MFIGFAPGSQQGLGIRTDLFFEHLADQFTNQGTTDGLQSRRETKRHQFGRSFQTASSMQANLTKLFIPSFNPMLMLWKFYGKNGGMFHNISLTFL